MNITINGNSMELDKEVRHIGGLLEHLKLADKPLIIEYNQEILKKEVYRQTELKNGDTLEIVHFVGGG